MISSICIRTPLCEKLCYYCLNHGVFEKQSMRPFVEAMLKELFCSNIYV